ncbi:MAG: hypothetical protein AAFU71_04220, partial [Cyanobacteria bacterium J06632_22]
SMPKSRRASFTLLAKAIMLRTLRPITALTTLQMQQAVTGKFFTTKIAALESLYATFGLAFR